MLIINHSVVLVISYATFYIINNIILYLQFSAFATENIQNKYACKTTFSLKTDVTKQNEGQLFSLYDSLELNCIGLLYPFKLPQHAGNQTTITTLLYVCIVHTYNVCTTYIVVCCTYMLVNDVKIPAIVSVHSY